MKNTSKDKKPVRRDFLFTASYAVGAVGVGAVVWPLIDQMNPDASVKALASTEVDVSSVQPGNTITVLWRGKPVFIRRRTQEEIEEARSVKMEELIHPEKDEDRAKNPEWLVMLGVCTHLGCAGASCRPARQAVPQAARRRIHWRSRRQGRRHLPEAGICHHARQCLPPRQDSLPVHRARSG